MICMAIGVLLPFSPLAHVLGFVPLPAGFLAVLALMIVLYLVLVELGKVRFYRVRPHGQPSPAAGLHASTVSITAPRAGVSPAAPSAQRLPTGAHDEGTCRKSFGFVQDRACEPTLL